MFDFITQSSWGIKIIYLCGIVNLVSIVLIFFSCRCFIQPNLFKKLVNYGWYRWFYKQHCWIWWIFFLSVLIHTIVAFTLFGNPL